MIMPQHTISRRKFLAHASVGATAVGGGAG